MLYCEECGVLYEEGRCPVCRKTHGRAPREDDPCFVAEKGQIDADILEDILRQNGIPCLKKSVSGAAIAVYTGRLLETFRVFVNFSQWEEACAIERSFFSAPAQFVEDDESENQGEADELPDEASDAPDKD